MLLYFNAVNLWLYRLLTVIATALYESAGRGKCPTKFGQYSGEDSAKQEQNSDRKKAKNCDKINLIRHLIKVSLYPMDHEILISRLSSNNV